MINDHDERSLSYKSVQSQEKVIHLQHLVFCLEQ